MNANLFVVVICKRLVYVLFHIIIMDVKLKLLFNAFVRNVTCVSIHYFPMKPLYFYFQDKPQHSTSPRQR